MKILIAAFALVTGAGSAMADDACTQFLPHMKDYAEKVQALHDMTRDALPGSAIDAVHEGKSDEAKADAREELSGMFGENGDTIATWGEATIDLLPVLEAELKAVNDAIAVLETCAD